MKTLIFTNQKGGVGKTASALSVGAALSKLGYKVLLIDIDPQGHLGKSCGVIPDESEPTICEILQGKARPADAIQKASGGYDIIPADIRLTGAEIELANKPGRDVILRQALQEVADEYQYAIIDAPPSLGILAIMGLTAADGVIIVLKSDFLALDGVAMLLDTIEVIKQRLNSDLKVTGVLMTFYNPRKKIAQDILGMIEEGLPGLVFNTKISTGVVMEEAPGFRKDIFQYVPKSKAKTLKAQYLELAKEIVMRTR